jgi:hypothetical protein
MRALDRDFQLLQSACLYPDRHIEREIHVWLPVIDLPLYQASHPLRLPLYIQYAFRYTLSSVEKPTLFIDMAMESIESDCGPPQTPEETRSRRLDSRDLYAKRLAFSQAFGTNSKMLKG